MPQPSLFSLFGEIFWVIENFEMLKRVVGSEKCFYLGCVLSWEDAQEIQAASALEEECVVVSVTLWL